MILINQKKFLNLFYNNINIDNLKIYKSENIIKLENFLINEIQMNEKRFKIH